MDSERQTANQARHHSGEDDLLGVIADVEKQLESLRQVKAERDEERAKLTERERAVRALEAAAAERAQQLTAREAELTAALAELQSRAERCEQDFRALAQAQQQAAAEGEKRASQLAGREAAMDEREQRLTESATATARERQGLEARAADLNEKENRLRAAAVELDRERTQMHAEAEAANNRAKEAQGAAEAARHEAARAEESRRAIAQELEARGAQLTDAQSKLREASDHAVSLSAQLAEKDQRVQDLTAKLGGATAKFREVSQTLKDQARMLGDATAMEADRRAKEQRIAELEAKLAAKGDHAEADASLRARIAGLEQDVQIRNERIAELEKAGPRSTKDNQAAAALQAELDKSRAELKAARKQMQAMKASLDAAQASGPIPEQIGQAITTRWRRLRLMRTLLQEQGKKIQKAGEAIRGRYEQTEQLKGQRDELVAARNAIAEARKKLDRMTARAAKGKAVSAVFHIIGILAALGGISWAVAGEVAPATFAARSTIAADNRTVAATPEQLAEWTKYHEELLKDPALMEVAADRMGRRGIESLATAGALSARLNADLSHEAPISGQIVMEFRGKGRGPTQRTLDTYVNALVSQSNAGKERRVDGLPTMIVETASVLDGPIVDPRPVYALAVFGAGFGLTGLLMLIIWKRLSAARTKFEEEAQIDALLDNVNWSAPPQAIAKPRKG